MLILVDNPHGPKVVIRDQRLRALGWEIIRIPQWKVYADAEAAAAEVSAELGWPPH